MLRTAWAGIKRSARIPDVEIAIGGGGIFLPLESAIYVENLSRSFFLSLLNLGIGAIVVGLGIDDPIHVLERFDEERRTRGRSARDAARVTLETIGPTTMACMLTTAVGFAASCVLLLLPMSTSFGLLTGASCSSIWRRGWVCAHSLEVSRSSSCVWVWSGAAPIWNPRRWARRPFNQRQCRPT